MLKWGDVIIADNRQNKEERNRNIKLVVSVLILSLGVSLIWLYFAGAFNFMFGNSDQNQTPSGLVSAVSYVDSSQVRVKQSSLRAISQEHIASAEQ